MTDCHSAIKFSVIIPVYNTGSFLERCVDSVLSQDYSEYEIIIVDDGSDDGFTSGECDKTGKRDNRIVIYHKEHGGLLHSRMYGVDRSTGDYIMFLDCDDFFAPSALSAAAKYICDYGVDLLIFGSQYVKLQKVIHRTSVVPGHPVVITDKHELYRVVFSSNRYINVWCKAIGRQLMKNTDYSDFYYLKQGEDVIQNLQYYQNARKTMIVDDVLYNYCYNPQSLTNSFSLLNIQHDIAVRGQTEVFLRNSGLFSEDDFLLFYQSCILMLAGWIKRISASDYSEAEKKEMMGKMQSEPFLDRLIRQPEVIRRMRPDYRIIHRLFLKSRFGLLMAFCRILQGIRRIQQKRSETAYVTDGPAVVSVIVPVYNAAFYLPKCIRSLLKQTCQNLEILLVNDGSTDRSGEICDRFASKNPRIKVIHQPHGGVASARNAGLEKASGKYVVFADADDWLTSDAVERLLKKTEQASSDFCFGVYRQMTNRRTVRRNEYAFASDRPCVSLSDLFQHIADFNSCWAKMYRLAILRENGIRFCEDMENAEDAVFLLDYLACCQSVSYCPSVVYHYCVLNRENASSRYYPPYDRWYLRYLSGLSDLKNKWGVPDQEGNPVIASRIAELIFNVCKRSARHLGKSETVEKLSETYELYSGYFSFVEKAGIRFSEGIAEERLKTEIFTLFKEKELEAVYTRLSLPKPTVISTVRKNLANLWSSVKKTIVYRCMPS